MNRPTTTEYFALVLSEGIVTQSTLDAWISDHGLTDEGFDIIRNLALGIVEDRMRSLEARGITGGDEYYGLCGLWSRVFNMGSQVWQDLLVGDAVAVA